METSSSRPYFAVFAIVAILIAAFILKNEYAGAAVDATGKDNSDPGMQLKETPAHWIQRVGWQKVGFTSQDQADQALQLFSVHRGQDFSDSQQQLIHQLIPLKGFPHDLALQMVTGIRNPDIERKFLPDIESQFDPNPDSQNTFDRTVLGTWYDRPSSKPVVLEVEKSKNTALAQYVKNMAYNHDYPSGNAPSGG